MPDRLGIRIDSRTYSLCKARIYKVSVARLSPFRNRVAFAAETVVADTAVVAAVAVAETVAAGTAGTAVVAIVAVAETVVAVRVGHIYSADGR